MIPKTVPIENIYYLLCYAWNRLAERDLVAVSTADCEHLLDLFARVLAYGTAHLMKRGLDRGYVTTSEDLRMIRGRIDMPTTTKQALMLTGRLRCDYDELSHNVLHNRILKTTVSQLVSRSALAPGNHDALVLLTRRLHQVEEIELSPSLFSRVQLNRNNAFYGFLLSICRLIYINVLAKEGQGDYLFRDFLRDPRQMGLLFQEFVGNFLRIEFEPRSPGCHVVGAEVINWDVEADEATKAFLPRMVTDISIRWPGRYVVIETKFYSETMQEHFDSQSLHSPHLYQLMTYLQQMESKGPEYEHCEGLLLYPTVTQELDLEFVTRGSPHRVVVKTVNLNQPWQRIHERLFAVVAQISSMAD